MIGVTADNQPTRLFTTLAFVSWKNAVIGTHSGFPASRVVGVEKGSRGSCG